MPYALPVIADLAAADAARRVKAIEDRRYGV
jgi:hypothetical protein